MRCIRDRHVCVCVLTLPCCLTRRHQDVDKLKGMKWLLAMVSKGRDVSEFFSDVVKNMAVRSVEVKKMVYIYLVHYADNDAQCRELALLSINSFQNDLRGSNQVCVCDRCARRRARASVEQAETRCPRNTSVHPWNTRGIGSD